MINGNKKDFIPDHFQNIIVIAYADGYLEEQEKEFLAERAIEFGLPYEAVENILQNARDLEFIVPQDEEEKEEQLCDAVYMSMINGEVCPKEYALCLHLAERMDMSKIDVDRIIELISKLWKHH